MPLDFRHLRIAVVYPRDRDGELLVRQLQRMGGTVDHVWPPPAHMKAMADIVVALICSETRELFYTLAETPQSALVGVPASLDRESLRLLVEASPHAVLGKPFEPVAVLSSLVVAHNNLKYQKRLLVKIAKLDETLRSVRKIERAKAVLMERRRLDEAAAYAYLREQAMKKRMPIGVIASLVIESDEVLPSSTE